MRLGIIGAMQVEVELLHERMDNVQVSHHAGLSFWEGTLNGTSCIVVQSGIGKVNAALCAQILASVFNVTHIINTGAAGSLDARFDIGDIVVATTCVQHDYDLVNLGYEPGQIPGYDSAYFSTDEKLSLEIIQAAHQAVPEVHAERGCIASGDIFVRTDDQKRRIAKVFGASCVEMEGAAIAQVCAANEIACAIVRAISDKADGSDAQDYPTFERQAAYRSALVVQELLSRLAE